LEVEEKMSEQQFVWNGRRKVDLRHLASSPYVKLFLDMHDLFYDFEWVTRQIRFYQRRKGVFVRLDLPPEIEQVLIEKCVVIDNVNKV
jgi:hypothetical protein